MTITITRTTEFQRTIPDDTPEEEIPVETDLTRLEANHHSEIVHEEITIAE